jgi:hypothetical protein
MKHIFIKRFFPLPATVFLFFILAGCAEKIINTEADTQKVQLSLKLSSAEEAFSFGLIHLTVTGPGIEEPIQDTLLEEGQFLVGEVNIPAGRDRVFTVEITEAYEGNYEGPVILRGETIADVVPNVKTALSISLYPVVPFMKLAPRYIRVLNESVFYLDLKVYNMDSLGEFGFSIYDDSYERVWIDSVQKSITLGSDVIVSGGHGDYSYNISIGGSDSAVSLVDANGNGTLARVYFHASLPMTLAKQTASQSDTLYIYSAYSSLIKINGDYFPEGIYYTDYCMIEIFLDSLTKASSKLLPDLENSDIASKK